MNSLKSLFVKSTDISRKVVRVGMLISVIALLSKESSAQCNVTGNATLTEITCGECVTLSHFGSTQGNVSFSENFNNGQPTGWSFTQQASFNNPCSPGGVDGTTHLWMGDNSGVPRSLVTLPLNFGPAVAPAGGTICFDMLFAEQGLASPCEGPDEPDEGVFLQYSTNGGTTWNTINYFDPNGGGDPQLINWNNWCFPIPAGALVNGVQFRWFQDADSGAEYDHWGIDNVEIIVNDPTVQYTWVHDGYTTPLPGDNPTAVCPLATTTYTVNMTSANGNCTDNVQVVVINPVVTVNAGPDQEICPGQCIALAGTANVINDPGGITTFSNIQTETFDASVFAGAGVNINVQGLNMSTVNPGSLLEVCITDLTFSGFGLPPGGVESLSLTLVCPDGTQIVLVPSGGAPAGPGGFFGQASYYQNACFVPSGGTTLSTIGSANATPITGTFNSNQSFALANGCTANGLWSIQVATTALTGSGTFDGWSITFDDEVDEYTADVLWSPTTYMTPGAETTLTPQVCPAAAIVYTLTATDNAGCVTVSDDVSITIGPNCCDPQTPPILGPTTICDNATNNLYTVPNTPGSIFTWTVPAGATIVSGQGTNSINVTFGTTSGNVTVVETINCGDGPPVTIAVIVQSCVNCAMNSLTMAMTDCYTSGGFLVYDVQGTLTFSSPPATGQLIVTDCFLNTQTFNPPFVSPLVFTYTGLPQDGQSCDFGAAFTADQACTITTSFVAPPTITFYSASCVVGSGSVDGTIEFNSPPATGTIVVSIFDGTNTQVTNIQPPFNSPEAWTVTGLNPAAANYVITYYFSDFPSCEQTQTIICGCAAEGGTTTTSITGDGTNNYILCEGDQLNIVNNGDFSLPDDEGPLGGFAYQPAYTFLVYGCPPTPGVFPPDDPCFAGIVPSNGSMTDINDPSSIFALFPPGLLPDNQLYYVPITLYHYDPIAGNYIVNANCWDLGTVSTVSYLPPVTSVVTPDCQTNTVTVTLNGGYPEVFGGNFTASNLQPANASFVNSTCINGGDIVIDGLLNGDNYSFDVTDANGCPHQITGGPFVALPITDAGADAQTCILSYTLEAVASYGTGTWSGGPGGSVFAPNANDPNATVTVPSAGTFTFTWTENNGNGCIGTDDVVVTFSLMSIPSVITNASCGSNDGEIVIAPQGGVGPYTYSWSSGGNSAIETGLGAGNVTVTVTDDTGCSLDSTFTITQPITFTYAVNSSDETCYQSCDGSIDIQPNGVGPFSYNWIPNVGNTGTNNALCADNYEIAVADNDGCTQIVYVTIGGPTEVTTNLSASSIEVCIGGSSTLSTTINGGTPPYNTYLWTSVPADPSLVSNAVSPTVSPLVSTTYTLVVTDANGCPSTPQTIIVDVLPPLTLNVIRPLASPDTSICPYDFATIDLLAGGGDGNYQIFLLPDNVNPISLPIDTQPMVTTTFNFMVIDGCGTPPAYASSTVTVHVLPPVIINAEPESGCQPLTVTFEDLTQPPSQGWTWNFGDPESNSNSASTSGPVHVYTEPGLYDVSLSIVTADGCITDTTMSDFIEVFPLPYASFVLDPEIVNLLNADITFTDLSTGNINAWRWTFGDGETSIQQNPTHFYGDTGLYTIGLTVMTIHGCVDETERQLIVEPDVMFYVPNAFSPNNDGRNDVFRGYGEGINWDTYEMWIYDRWGEMIYYTADINDPWLGIYKGKAVELAVYVWKIRFYDVKGEPHDHSGHVTLLR